MPIGSIGLARNRRPSACYAADDCACRVVFNESEMDRASIGVELRRDGCFVTQSAAQRQLRELRKLTLRSGSHKHQKEFNIHHCRL